MAITTNIEWCDSTCNPEMGCDGCELWNKKTRLGTCYAFHHISRYAGKSKGYPADFGAPELFLDRLTKLSRWPDLTGKQREGKPWLDGYPRLVFLNDLGDTFTESLPIDWLGQASSVLSGFSPLQILAQCKAIIMLLTKRPERMRRFFETTAVPDNFILMTSVTGPENLNRVRDLLRIDARWHGVSAEPLLRGTDFDEFAECLDLVIAGGESGIGKRASELNSFRTLRDRCAYYGVSFFMKQIDKVQAIPDDLNIRQLPKFTLKPRVEAAHG